MTVLDVIIVGGGLSGLLVARGLEKHQQYRLLEASARLGGRLLGEIDMGGAWLWPHHQPHIKQFIKDIGIETFPQPDDPSSTRVRGGAVSMIHKLADRLDSQNVLLESPVTKCSLQEQDGEKLVRVQSGTNEYLARRVVLAVPPALIAKRIDFDPPLSKEKQQAMEKSHTWMAGVTKVALEYPDRFWDLKSSNTGLRGAPAFQVYDSGTTKIPALTFFTHVPPEKTAWLEDDNKLAQAVATQMAWMWKAVGLESQAERATSYTACRVQRWPHEPYISEERHPAQIHPHPYPIRALSESEWDNRLHFAGSESDLQSPGVMEGALGAAKRVLEVLRSCSR